MDSRRAAQFGRRVAGAVRAPEKSLIAVVALSAVVSASSALALQQPGRSRPARDGRFGLSLQSFLDDARRPSARVIVDVPFGTLVFFKHERGYRARFDVTVLVRKEGGGKRPVRSVVIRGEALAQTYADTDNRTRRARVVRSFPLPPGDYQCEVSLRVRDTHLSFDRIGDLRVPDFMASGIGFGMVELLSALDVAEFRFSTWREFVASRPVAAQSFDQTVSSLDRYPAIHFVVHLKEKPEGRISGTVFYEVLDPAGNRKLYGRRGVQLDGDGGDFVLAFNVDDWEPGPYRVNLRAATADPERETTASVRFNVDVTRAMLGVYFRDTLDILSLIARSDELSLLRDAPEEDRPRAWNAFWARRDPDPSTPENEALEEHLRRLRVVAERFGGSDLGWRTDRGRVYIRHGSPDRVERVPDRRFGGEYEVWRYFDANRTFVFHDVFGTGDFRLTEGALF